MPTLYMRIIHNKNFLHVLLVVISVVRYPRYLDTYCRYLCDDTSIAIVTIYRSIS